MKTKKMSLANIQGRLSRTEMKKIMAGSGVVCVCSNGEEVGIASCANCFTYCNTSTRQGVSCSDGDCTNYPNG